MSSTKGNMTTQEQLKPFILHNKPPMMLSQDGCTTPNMLMSSGVMLPPPGSMPPMMLSQAGYTSPNMLMSSGLMLPPGSMPPGFMQDTTEGEQQQDAQKLGYWRHRHLYPFGSGYGYGYGYPRWRRGCYGYPCHRGYGYGYPWYI